MITPRNPLLGSSILSLCYGLSVLFCPMYSEETIPSVIRDHVKAVITTPKDAYDHAQNIKCRVVFSNDTDRTLFVLKESYSGPVWADAEHRKIVLAHYAFTHDRENALRGGWTLREVYQPEFYKVEAGHRLSLDWNLGKGHGPGQWRLEGQISALLNIPPLGGMTGDDVAEAIARSDFLVPCAPKIVSVR